MSREQWSCVYCKSNVRWRSVIHALSLQLFGRSLALPEFPRRPDISGLGLSDWEGYARRLQNVFSYTNTFYHKEPFLDITQVQPEDFGRYDFIISSDVFEHICPPISRAFENAQKLLKPGGFMVLTVPYVEGKTREHYPEAYQFSVAKKNGNWSLTNRTADGVYQEFPNPTFHGGPGTTVEFRIFGKESLMKDCVESGFQSVHIVSEAVEQFGIVWNAYRPEAAPYRPMIYGLDTPPWVALKEKEQISQ